MVNSLLCPKEAIMSPGIKLKYLSKVIKTTKVLIDKIYTIIYN